MTKLIVAFRNFANAPKKVVEDPQPVSGSLLITIVVKSAQYFID